MIRRISMALLLLWTAGCATNLQKADRLLAQGRFAEARGLYQMELDEQRKAAELPRWTGREYQFQFNPLAASQAILGVGNAYREEGQTEPALYHYSYFLQFCLRHGLDADAEVAEIERWVKESGLGMPVTEPEPAKPVPAPKRTESRVEESPAAPPPAAAAKAEAAPVAVRKAPAPAAPKKTAKKADAEEEKPAKPAEKPENEDEAIYW